MCMKGIGGIEVVH